MNSDLDKRRDELELRLKKHSLSKKTEPEATKTTGMNGVAQAFKISSEFIAGILVGAVMGWGIDHFLGTSPWGLIIFLLLGFCAGTLNVLRASGKSTQHEINKPDQ